ncbi:MAG: hypothetical protein BA873_07680 [Desulfobulbaceae bacterium C00003063]|nr:MAG: hypothetical protein BA873_07680 [Desulfobulbaceae bacterium C00003063]
MSQKAKLIFASLSIGMMFLLIFVLFVFTLQFSHKHYAEPERYNHAITKRRLPYPFKSALAICSDIDATDSLKEFLTIQEFLNTKNTTDMGVGLGLEIGNSFFPIETSYGPFALISNNPADKEVIIDLIKLGYIDFIHSFNEANRREIKEITNILSNSGCRLDVWVNHCRAPTNLGYREWCLGDNINSNHYHTDFSIRTLGYIFVWTSDVSSIAGQGVPLNLHSFFTALDREHLVQSLYRNVFKEIYKYLLSLVGGKYSNRKHNDLIYPVRLEDGQYAFGFVRSNISYRGIGATANSVGLADILREDTVKELNESGGYMIIYTHLGKNNGYPYFSKATQKALRLLEREYRNGNIYVTTTARLLKYYVNNKYLIWHSTISGNESNIYIECISDPVRGSFVPTIDDLRGISFYTNDPTNTHVFIQEKEITEIMSNENDYTNRKSIMIPLKPLPRLDSKMREYKKKGYFGSLAIKSADPFSRNLQRFPDNIQNH